MILYEVTTTKAATHNFFANDHFQALRIATQRFGMKNVVSLGWETHNKFGWLIQRS